MRVTPRKNTIYIPVEPINVFVYLAMEFGIQWGRQPREFVSRITFSTP